MEEYSKRLGVISPDQFQAALDRFGLGTFVTAAAIPFGLFGQNVLVTSTAGRFVLRGAALHTWQFQKERFVANVLHEQSTVPVPWPYHFDEDESLFGWPHGYAVMPYMPGLSLADEAVLKRIPVADRVRIARLLGETLRDVQQTTWPHAGQYDVDKDSIQPFPGAFSDWLVDELRRLLRVSISYGTGATEADAAWAEQIIQDAAQHVSLPGPAVLVLHDYKEGNVTVERGDDGWRISGVFDLVEALFGDGELDLIRQLAAYLEEPVPALARALLDGYQKQHRLRPGADRRLALYLTYERMVIWEYYHQPGNLHQWWYAEKTPRDWVTPYLSRLPRLV